MTRHTINRSHLTREQRRALDAAATGDAYTHPNRVSVCRRLRALGLLAHDRWAATSIGRTIARVAVAS